MSVFTVPPIDLVSPQAVPSLAATKSELPAQFKKVCANHCRNASDLSNVSLGENIERVLLNFPLEATLGNNSGIGFDESCHDDYFRIRRTTGSAPFIFVRSIFYANWLLCRDSYDSEFTTPPERLNCVNQALSDLLTSSIGLPTVEKIQVREWRSTGMPCNTMQRWIRGHQLFAVLTQGLVLCFRGVKRAEEAGDLNEVAGFIDLAVSLLRGSAASLEFTGDFPGPDYCNVIRPTMKPPLVPDSFSGLLAADHRYFVQILRDMKPELESINQRDKWQHQRLAQAVSEVYDSHRHVCERFVGGKPSLMMAASSVKSGGEQIETFKRLRLKSFESEASEDQKCPFTQVGY
jgi:hypothetical protein